MEKLEPGGRLWGSTSGEKDGSNLDQLTFVIAKLMNPRIKLYLLISEHSVKYEHKN